MQTGLKIIAAATFWLTLVMPAAAEVLSLDGKAVTIEPIAGYCAIDRSRDVERQAFSSLESALGAESRLLGYWVECQTLEAVRSQGSHELVPYILILASKRNDRLFETNLKRQDVLKQMQTHFAASFGNEPFLSDASDQARMQADKAVREFESGVKSSGQTGARKTMGMMGRDDEAVYSAEILASGGPQAPMASVTGTTVIKKLIMSAVAYDRYMDAKTFLLLKDRAGTAMRSLIAANRTGE
ncbi:MAG TPA: hypothetical protein VH835_02125 [Dongiaceae bacterium]